MGLVEIPGSARLVLVEGVVHLNEQEAVFEAMLEGWARQQRSRLLGVSTIRMRDRLIRRFAEFAECYPWVWRAADVEDFTVSLTSGKDRLALSTIRGYHLALRMFCDYLVDARYEWTRQCRDRFNQLPVQVCHEWNTVAHLNDYEGRPQRRPLTYEELQRLLDYLDDRVDRIATMGRKGSASALRDALMIKTTYAYGLRRNELARLDLADLRPNPHMPEWGTYGAVHVRFGKSIKGSLPRRRTVLTVPEFDWIVPGLQHRIAAMDRPGPSAVSGRRPSGAVADRAADPGQHPAHRFPVRGCPGRDRARPQPDPALPAALLCDPFGGVRLPGAVRHRAGGPRLRLEHRDLHLGVQRLQKQGLAEGAVTPLPP